MALPLDADVGHTANDGRSRTPIPRPTSHPNLRPLGAYGAPAPSTRWVLPPGHSGGPQPMAQRLQDAHAHAQRRITDAQDAARGAMERMGAGAPAALGMLRALRDRLSGGPSPSRDPRESRDHADFRAPWRADIALDRSHWLAYLHQIGMADDSDDHRHFAQFIHAPNYAEAHHAFGAVGWDLRLAALRVIWSAYGRRHPSEPRPATPDPMRPWVEFEGDPRPVAYAEDFISAAVHASNWLYPAHLVYVNADEIADPHVADFAEATRQHIQAREATRTWAVLAFLFTPPQSATFEPTQLVLTAVGNDPELRWRRAFEAACLLGLWRLRHQTEKGPGSPGNILWVTDVQRDVGMIPFVHTFARHLWLAGPDCGKEDEGLGCECASVMRAINARPVDRPFATHPFIPPVRSQLPGGQSTDGPGLGYPEAMLRPYAASGGVPSGPRPRAVSLPNLPSMSSPPVSRETVTPRPGTIAGAYQQAAERGNTPPTSPIDHLPPPPPTGWTLDGLLDTGVRAPDGDLAAALHTWAERPDPSPTPVLPLAVMEVPASVAHADDPAATAHMAPVTGLLVEEGGDTHRLTTPPAIVPGPWTDPNWKPPKLPIWPKEERKEHG